MKRAIIDATLLRQCLQKLLHPTATSPLETNPQTTICTYLQSEFLSSVYT